MQNYLKTLIRGVVGGFAIASLFACGGGGDVPQRAAMSPAPPSLSALSSAPTNPVATFSGPRTNYTITRTSTGFSVKDNVGSGGTVTLVSQTSAQFTDMSVNLVVGDKSKTIPADRLKSLVELYIAFFNRVPDGDGMAYWIDQIKAGMTNEDLSRNFYAAALLFPDQTHYTASMSNADFIRIIYKNVLGRDEVDQGGMDYWTNSLVTGSATRGTLINTIIGSAHTFKGDAELGWVADLLDNKVEVGMYFSVQQGLSYPTNEISITEGMKIAAKVTPTDTSAAKALVLVSASDRLLDLSASVSTPAFDKVQAIVNAKCIECHSATRAENRIALHTAALIRLNAQPLYIVTVVQRSMPQNGSLTEQQIADISAWFKSGAQ